MGKVEDMVKELMEQGRPVVKALIKEHLDSRPSQSRIRTAFDNVSPAQLMPLMQKYGHQDGEQVKCPFCRVYAKQITFQDKRVARETVRIVKGA